MLLSVCGRLRRRLDRQSLSVFCSQKNASPHITLAPKSLREGERVEIAILGPFCVSEARRQGIFRDGNQDFLAAEGVFPVLEKEERLRGGNPRAPRERPPDRKRASAPQKLEPRAPARKRGEDDCEAVVLLARAEEAEGKG